MSPQEHPTCAACPVPPRKRACIRRDGTGPENCPTLNQQDLVDEARRALSEETTFEFARQASLQEAAGYTSRDLGYARIQPAKPRIRETVEFAARMGYERLGLAFCAGLAQEAGTVQQILETNGFRVVSAICKSGCVPKSSLGLGQEEHIDQQAEEETMCHPVLQAYLLNRFQTELNILLGLCVGHDALLMQHVRAPCTVLAAKDRLLGHAPLTAIYTFASYYRYLQHPLEGPSEDTDRKTPEV